MADAPHSRLLTKRMVLSVGGLAVATVALFTGKMDGATWVYSFAVSLAGHHAEDIVKAFRGGPA